MGCLNMLEYLLLMLNMVTIAFSNFNPPCLTPLGLRYPATADHALTFDLAVSTGEPDSIRLNGPKAWRPANISESFVEINMSEPVLLTALQIQGDPRLTGQISGWLLDTSFDCETYKTENYSLDSVNAIYTQTVFMKNLEFVACIRLRPTHFKGKSPALRLELLGCAVQDNSYCDRDTHPVTEEWLDNGGRQLSFKEEIILSWLKILLDLHAHGDSGNAGIFYSKSCDEWKYYEPSETSIISVTSSDQKSSWMTIEMDTPVRARCLRIFPPLETTMKEIYTSTCRSHASANLRNLVTDGINGKVKKKQTLAGDAMAYQDDAPIDSQEVGPTDDKFDTDKLMKERKEETKQKVPPDDLAIIIKNSQAQSNASSIKADGFLPKDAEPDTTVTGTQASLEATSPSSIEHTLAPQMKLTSSSRTQQTSSLHTEQTSLLTEDPSALVTRPATPSVTEDVSSTITELALQSVTELTPQPLAELITLALREATKLPHTEPALLPLTELTPQPFAESTDPALSAQTEPSQSPLTDSTLPPLIEPSSLPLRDPEFSPETEPSLSPSKDPALSPLNEPSSLLKDPTSSQLTAAEDTTTLAAESKKGTKETSLHNKHSLSSISKVVTLASILSRSSDQSEELSREPVSNLEQQEKNKISAIEKTRITESTLSSEISTETIANIITHPRLVQNHTESNVSRDTTGREQFADHISESDRMTTDYMVSETERNITSLATTEEITDTIQLSDSTITTGSTENGTLTGSEILPNISKSEKQHSECGVKGFTKGFRKRRVTSGDVNIPGEWPWLVSMHFLPEIEFTRMSGFKHTCGASLISSNWVLSAAHCFEEDVIPGAGLSNLTNWRIYFGMHDLARQDEQKFVQERLIEAVYIYPEYNITNMPFVYDVAIVKLNEPVEVNERVSPLCLDETDLYNKEIPCVVTGWGQLTPTSPGSRFPHSAVLSTLLQSKCKNKYDLLPDEHPIKPFVHIVDPMLCATGGDNGEDACQGDSGGPLMCEHGGRWYQSGIVAAGYLCGNNDTPGLYSRVSYYASWIRNITQIRGDSW